MQYSFISHLHLFIDGRIVPSSPGYHKMAMEISHDQVYTNATHRIPPALLLLHLLHSLQLPKACCVNDCGALWRAQWCHDCFVYHYWFLDLIERYHLLVPWLESCVSTTHFSHGYWERKLTLVNGPALHSYCIYVCTCLEIVMHDSILDIKNDWWDANSSVLAMMRSSACIFPLGMSLEIYQIVLKYIPSWASNLAGKKQHLVIWV